MLKSLVPWLRCPTCAPQPSPLRLHDFGSRENGGERHVHSGVLVCDSCSGYYAIEDDLAELVPSPLQDQEARAAFVARFSPEIARLGLEKLVAAPSREVDQSAVADQLKQRQHFDWYAENQDQSYQEYQRTPFWRAADAQTLRRWRPRVRPNSRILDVGCADGRGGFYFTDVPGVTLIGFDISRKMVANAIQRAQGDGFADRSSFLVADAASLPFCADTFDVVITYGVLHHLPDPGRSTRELQDLLKPGGVHLAFENNLTLARPVFDFMMKFLPLWKEEAGAEPLISQGMVREWVRGLPVRLTSATSVFVPPHLLNWLGRGGADTVLRATDALAQSFPLVRDQGGLIMFEVEKASN